MSTPDVARPDTQAPQDEVVRRQKSLGEMSRPAVAVCQVGLAVTLLVVWQAASGRLVDRFFVSDPAAVGARLVEWTLSGFIFVHLWVTFYETVGGFVAGSLIGILLGVGLGISPWLSRLLSPFLFGFYALPKIALAPLFVLWFGLGMESKVALSAVIVFFLVFLNTYSGVREVDPDLIDTVRLMRGTPWQVLTRVIVPSSRPWMFAGLRIAVPYALIGAIVGELIAANAGLGYLLQLSGAEFDTTGVFAVLVVIGLLAMALDLVVNTAQARLERWKLVAS